MTEKICYLDIIRSHYTARTSIGDMYFSYDGKKERFCFTLEDTARPHNIKVYGETCIPECECDVDLYESEHFGKTIRFYTEPDKRTIKVGILTWVDVLAHGGNTHLDTKACVCVAKNRINDDYIQESMKDELRKFVEEKVKEGYKIKARFINLDQLK